MGQQDTAIGGCQRVLFPVLLNRHLLAPQRDKRHRCGQNAVIHRRQQPGQRQKFLRHRFHRRHLPCMKGGAKGCGYFPPPGIGQVWWEHGGRVFVQGARVLSQLYGSANGGYVSAAGG